MWPILRRVILPALLALGGLASLIYGGVFHGAPVLTETETEATIEVPAPFSPAPFSPGRSGFPGGPPPMVKKVVKRIDVNTVVELEPALTRELSVGGVTRVESGELKQTYSSNKGPSLCPS